MLPNIKKYTIKKKNKIIEYEDAIVFIKEKKRYDIQDVYCYLEDHNVNNYLKPLKIREKDIIFPYLPKTSLSMDRIKRLLIK